MELLDNSADLPVALTGTYDLALVALSVFIAALGSFSALELADRIRAAQWRFNKFMWLATGAVAMGSGVWGMHFTGMLAFSLPVPVAYDLVTTLVSIIPAVFASGVALYLMSCRKLEKTRIVAGGIVIGAGIGAMHHMGMMAMRMDAVMRYDPILLAGSILAAIVLAIFALYIKILDQSQASKIHLHWTRFASAWLMGFAVAAMHYIAMTAVSFFPTGASGAEIVGLNPKFLAVLTGLVTVGLIALSNIASAVGRRLETALLLETEVIERRHTEKALKESESRFRDIAEVAGDWIWEMDSNLRFSFISSRFFKVFSIAREDVIGKTRAEFAGATVYDEHWRRHFADLASHHPFRDFAYTTQRYDGRPRHIVISGKPVFDANGTFKGYRGTGTDKSAEVEVRVALEESERQFRNLVEGSIQGVFVHKDWDTLFANQALADIFGYRSPEEILALKRVDPLIAPAEHERLRGYRTARRKGEYAPEIYEARGLKKDGSILWLEFRVTQIDWRGIAAIQCVVIDITERKNSEILNLRLARIVEDSINEVYVFDAETLKFVQVNATACENLGYTMEELLALTPLDLKPEHTPETFADLVTPLRNGEKDHIQFETMHRRKDGSHYDVKITLQQIRSDDRAVFAAIIEDITEHKKAEKTLQRQNEELRERDKELKDQNALFTTALDNMSQGLCMFDGEQRLVVCNERYGSIYGLSTELLKPGILFRQILEYRIANGIYAGETPEKYIQERTTAVTEGKASTKIQELGDGRIIAIAHQPMPGGGWLATHEDITELRRIEARLAHMAHHDALTDLPNRVLLRERIEEELKRAKRGESFALLCLDLDQFKNVNDTLGHPAGDELLKAVAERLRGCVRETNVVARLGGDEFAMIQVATGQRLDVAALAKRICKAISVPFQIEDHEVVIETSIGIAIAPDDGTDPEELLKKADMALYRAKSEGPGSYCLFEPELEERVKMRHALGLDLRKALPNGELEVYYQPLVNLDENKVSGFEALLRWTHPVHGAVSPDIFIPLAEQMGLINNIGKWVLRQACLDAATWPGDLKIAVNISPVQFKNHSPVQAVISALAQSDLPSSRLELEITETVLLQDDQMTLTKLHQLRDLGVRILMDDFGTGYSSLSYLRSFPFDKIKIDASFVSGLCKGDEGAGIVQAIVGLASNLGVTTTAEGVETEEQLEIVRREGCTEAQGYLFSHPMPAGEISRFLSQYLKLSERLESAA